MTEHILDNKLAVIAHHAKEARAILDDERADMRRECEARVALAVEVQQDLDICAARIAEIADDILGVQPVCSSSLPLLNAIAARHEQERLDRIAAIAREKTLRDALRHAEAALSDIGDADREPGDDVSWCERRASNALPWVRRVLDMPAPREATTDIASRWVPVAERDAAIARAEKAEARAKAGISAHDDVDAAGWVERVATALGLWYDYDGPFVAAESAEVVARIKADQAELAAVAELDAERRLRFALERAAVEPTPSNARVKVDHLVLAGVLDTYTEHVTQQRPTFTVPQAVALQAILGDHLPEGAIVIEGSSALDPEEVARG